MNIYLIGFMGSGKSTVSEVLSRMTGWDRIEVDERIVDREKMSIADVFAVKGEVYFRDVETEVVRELGRQERKIISCGGGTVLRRENVDAMKAAGTILWLTAEPETVYDRVKDSTDRPVLNGHMSVDYIRSLMEKRHDCYARAADRKVVTDGKSAEMIAEEIAADCGISPA